MTQGIHPGEITASSRSLEDEPFRKILIADDGTAEGERAAKVGLHLAAKLQAEVVLLGVVEPPNVGAAGEGLPVEAPQATKHRLEQRFYGYFKLGRSLELEMSAEIVEGWAQSQIEKRARDEQVDLIVVGARRLNWFERWFVRSNPEALMRRSGYSVMGIR